jgi:hypothetical protein
MHGSLILDPTNRSTSDSIAAYLLEVSLSLKGGNSASGRKKTPLGRWVQFVFDCTFNAKPITQSGCDCLAGPPEAFWSVIGARAGHALLTLCFARRLVHRFPRPAPRPRRCRVPLLLPRQLARIRVDGQVPRRHGRSGARSGFCGSGTRTASGAAEEEALRTGLSLGMTLTDTAATAMSKARAEAAQWRTNATAWEMLGN